MTKRAGIHGCSWGLAWVGLVCLTLRVSAADESPEQQTPSARALVEELSGTLGRQPERVLIHGRCEAVYDHTFPGMPRRRGTGRAEYTYRRDGARIDVETETAEFDEEGRERPEFRANRRAILAGGALRYQAPDDAYFYPDGAAVKGTVVLSNLLGGEELDGYFTRDGAYLPEVLLAASDLSFVKVEKVDGVACHVVNATTPYGRFTVWLDREFGNLPRKLTCRKRRNDICGNTRVSEWPKQGDPAAPSTLREVILSTESIRLKRVDGLPVALACRSVEVLHFDRGRTMTSRRTVVRTSVNFDPKFDPRTAFRADIPEGTRVRVKDSNHFETPGTLYEWRDGEVVPVESE